MPFECQQQIPGLRVGSYNSPPNITPRQVRMNVKEKRVELRTSRHTKNPELIQTGADFVSAFAMGFDVDDCVALLRLDSLYIQTFDIKDVKFALSMWSLPTGYGSARRRSHLTMICPRCRRSVTSYWPSCWQGRRECPLLLGNYLILFLSLTCCSENQIRDRKCYPNEVCFERSGIVPAIPAPRRGPN